MKPSSIDSFRNKSALTPPSTLLPRFGAALLLLALIGMMVSLASFKLDEINWQTINPHADAAAPNTANSNTLGLVGLYVAGMSFHLLGAASWWITLLLFYIPARLLLIPHASLFRQLICLIAITLTSTATLSIQPWLLVHWAQAHTSSDAGGLLGHLIGTDLLLPVSGIALALIPLLILHAIALIYYSDSSIKQVVHFFCQDCRNMRRRLSRKDHGTPTTWKEIKQELERQQEQEKQGIIQPTASNPLHVAKSSGEQQSDDNSTSNPPRSSAKTSKQQLPTARNRAEETQQPPPTLAPHHTLTPEQDEEDAPPAPRNYQRPTASPSAPSSPSSPSSPSTPSTPSPLPPSASTPTPAGTPVPKNAPLPAARPAQPASPPSPPAPKLPSHRVIAAQDMSGYDFPPLNILHYEPVSAEVDQAAQEEMQRMQILLLETLSSFGYEVEPGDITRGPSITRYEIYPAKGLRINRITALRKDLMLATSSESINIIAPIPGKNSIGIELANEKKSPVFLRELLQDESFLSDRYRIPVALGKDVYGKTVIGDLASMPHTLVAGTTGSGKSVCINCMIISMLYKFTPADLKLVLIDPKTVEMQPYLRIPHLACPVVTEPARAIGALRWAVNEMEHRYRLFSRFGVRNYEDYNACSKDELPDQHNYWDDVEDDEVDYERIEAMAEELERQGASGIPLEEEDPEELELDALEDVPEKLPYIVIIIDELADLMMIVKEDLENYVARLTQKARAAGIHLVVATQTPRSNVVTGIIKANIPSRIAFKVSSPLDSRIILDMDGADNLLGRGDCLFLPPTGVVGLTRAQGAFVSDREIQNVVIHCATQVRQRFIKSATAELNNCASGAAGAKGSGAAVSQEAVVDELYDRCVEMIIRERKASTSMIQRRFRVGYNRASLIMETLEQNGVVSAPRGGKSERDILIDAPEEEEESE